MNEKDYQKQQQNEVDKNYEAFSQKIKEEGGIDSSLIGKFALMKGEKIIDYFNTWEDAYKAGEIAYKDKLFSIQEITRDSINLGYYSYAII